MEQPGSVELFVLEAWESMIRLDRCFDCQLTESTASEAMVLAHRLKGSAGLQGLASLVHAAEALERLLQVANENPEAVPADRLRGRLDPMVKALLLFPVADAASASAERSSTPTESVDATVVAKAQAEPEPPTEAVEASAPEHPAEESATEPNLLPWERLASGVSSDRSRDRDSADDTQPTASPEKFDFLSVLKAPVPQPNGHMNLDESADRPKNPELSAFYRSLSPTPETPAEEPSDPQTQQQAESESEAAPLPDPLPEVTAEEPEVDAEPPVGHVGSFESTEAEVEPSPEVRSADEIEVEMLRFMEEKADTLSYFRPEVEELLETVGSSLRRETNDADKDWVHRLFRAFHTIKGSSFIVGCRPLGDLAHLAEDHLSRVREGAVAQPDLRWLTRVHRLANAMLWFDGTSDRSLGADFAAVKALMPSGETAEPEAQAPAAAPATPAEDASHGLGSLPLAAPMLGEVDPTAETTASTETTVLEAEGIAPQPAEEAPVPTETTVQAAVGKGAAEPAPTRRGGGFETLRVEVHRIDRIINGLSEIASQRSQLETTIDSLADLRYQVEIDQRRVSRFATTFEQRIESIEHGGSLESERQPAEFGVGEFEADDDLGLLSRQIVEIAGDLKELGERLDVEISQIRSRHGRLHKSAATLRTEMGRLRMVPMSRVFSRLRRSFESATPPDMDVRFEVRGESTEVDNAVFEGVFEALEHVLRNAVAHGIESPDERIALGKEGFGTVRVEATQTRTNVRLEIADDGRGIDLKKVVDKAVALGLRTREQIAAMPPARLWELILLPGLSTQTEVDLRSGRGVGMDVVANRVRRVGGELSVETKPGKGTSFIFELPLTLVVSDVLVFRAADRAFALPSRRVQKVVPFQRSAETSTTGREIEIDGEALPLVAIEGLLGIERHAPPELGGAALRVRTADGSRAFEVDSIHGVEEVVLRSPGAFLEPLDYLQGAFVADDGEIVLVLNPEGLARVEERAVAVVAEAGDRPARALLVDDSVSVRRVVGDQLRQLGLVVEVAGDGIEALKALEQESFDLVLTDLEMPNMHGYELIERIRVRYSDLPVVVMSTRVSEKHREAATRLGVSQVFAKPVAPEELRTASLLASRRVS